MIEKTLLQEFIQHSTEVDRMEKVLEEEKKKKIDAETRLREYLESQGASSTARYDDLGRYQLNKPMICASIKGDSTTEKELNKFTLLDYFREHDLSALITTTVPAKTLSSWVKERLEEGLELPDCIEWYAKPQGRVYK